MSKPSNWSKPSRAFRIELRPSRQLAGATILIGALAALACSLTNAPPPVAGAAALATFAWSVRLAREESARGVVAIAVGGDGTVEIDGSRVESLTVTWRSALVSLAWRSGGAVHRRLAFPDALDPGARRELRLWALSRRERANAPAVAP